MGILSKLSGSWPKKTKKLCFPRTNIYFICNNGWNFTTTTISRWQL